MRTYTEAEFEVITNNFSESSDGGNFALSGSNLIAEFEVFDQVYFVIVTETRDAFYPDCVEHVLSLENKNRKIYGTTQKRDAIDFYLSLQCENLMKY